MRTQSNEQQHRVQREKVRKFYDQQVISQPANPTMLGVDSAFQAECRNYFELQRFQRLVPLRKDMSILELGCGTGRWCEFFSTLTGCVTGVDLSPNAIARAQREACTKKLQNLEYYSAAIEEFQPLRSYDLIYFSGVALYLENDVLQEMIVKYAANLVDAGFIVVRDSITNQTHHVNHVQGYGAKYRSLDDFIGMFADNGFVLAGHEKAFNGVCLSSLLSSTVGHGIFHLFKRLSLEKLLFELLGRLFDRKNAAHHWQSGDFVYDHDFLLFIRANGRVR